MEKSFQNSCFGSYQVSKRNWKPAETLALVFEIVPQTPENRNDINLHPYRLQLYHGRQENSLKPATHFALLYADRGEFDRQRFSPPIDVDTPRDFFFRRSQRCGSFENSCDKIAQP